jgi:hypothetical protein
VKSRLTRAALTLLIASVLALLIESAQPANADNSNLWWVTTATVTCGTCVVLANNDNDTVLATTPVITSVVAADDCSEWYQNNAAVTLNSADGFWAIAVKIHVVGSSCNTKFRIGYGRH